MTDEPLEIWEHRMNELLDAKVNPIITELEQLKSEHEKLVKEYSQTRLEVQQYIAGMLINDSTSSFSDIINSNRLSQANALSTQLTIDASNAKQYALHSSEPFKELRKFRDKWEKTLRDLGCTIIQY